jgi:hypothetical protein
MQGCSNSHKLKGRVVQVTNKQEDAKTRAAKQPCTVEKR